MVTRRDLHRLAVRIERLHGVSTHGWLPADAVQFRGLLQRLPDVEELRAQPPAAATPDAWRTWGQLVVRAEGLVRDNTPGSAKRLLRDLARGRWPGRR